MWVIDISSWGNISCVLQSTMFEYFRELVNVVSNMNSMLFYDSVCPRDSHK